MLSYWLSTIFLIQLIQIYIYIYIYIYMILIHGVSCWICWKVIMIHFLEPQHTTAYHSIPQLCQLYPVRPPLSTCAQIDVDGNEERPYPWWAEAVGQLGQHRRFPRYEWKKTRHSRCFHVGTCGNPSANHRSMVGFPHWYHLVMTNIAMGKSPCLIAKPSIIFHGYVKWPEGTLVAGQLAKTHLRNLQNGIKNGCISVTREPRRATRYFLTITRQKRGDQRKTGAFVYSKIGRFFTIRITKACSFLLCFQAFWPILGWCYWLMHQTRGHTLHKTPSCNKTHRRS